MNRSSLALLLLALGPAAACNCGAVSPNIPGADAGTPPECSPACATGMACDPATLTCVPALLEGALCGTVADGGVVEGVCAPGLSCGPVGSQKRCSKDCSAADAAKICGEARKCFARPGGSAATGYCGSAATEGQPCADSQLVKCTGDALVCVNAGGETAGRCFHYCDPRVADPNPECAPGTSCANLFPDDPAKGVCVVPVARYPARCDYSTLAFCGRNEACVRPTEEPWGYCHTRCASPSDCTGGESCAQPTTGLSICVAPVARCVGAATAGCAACSAADDRYCGAEDLCVRLGGDTVCKQDCTGGKACAAGACKPVVGTERSVCLE